MAKNLILFACALTCAGVTECGAVGGGAVGGSPSSASAGTTTCSSVRTGGECPTDGICKIAVVGDSIPTRPQPGTDDLATNLQSLLGLSCADVDNFATAGNTCALVMSAQYPDNVQGNGYHVIINNCGVNDINGAIATSTILANREALSAAALAEGGQVVVDLSVMPWGGFASHTAGKQTETDSLNASLSTPVNAITTYVDTYSGMEDDVTPDDLEADYDSGDGLHPNAAGAAALAAIVYTELTTP